jgi:hypothetical protein
VNVDKKNKKAKRWDVSSNSTVAAFHASKVRRQKKDIKERRGMRLYREVKN